MADWAPFIWALTPTILVGLAFWFVMRAIVRGDRNERAAYAKLEAEERQRRARAAEESAATNPRRAVK